SIMNVLLIMQILIVIAEFFIGTYYVAYEGFTPLIFFRKYIFIPSVINFIVIILGNLFIKAKRFSDEQKNYAVMITLCIMVTTIEAIHFCYVSIFSVFIIVIFISTIFMNRKMTTMVYGISYCSLLLVVFIAKTNPDDVVPMLWQNVLVSALMLYASFLLARVLIDYHNDQTLQVVKSYQEKLELKEELKLDPLTRLYNINAFTEMLTEFCEKSRLENKTIQLAIIDIDDFKHLNDNFGHLNGNTVITSLAQILCNNLPDDVMISRYGGEEFAIIFTNYSTNDAFKCMDNIRYLFSDKQFDFGTKKISVTFSCGIAEFKRTVQNEKQLFEIADKAMYIAKAEGKNKTVTY
ncbi:MAG: GGDEF domain-containing protein, partial [Oscillospiraceae bacterium]